MKFIQTLAALAASLGLATVTSNTFAQEEFPSRPVRLVVSTSAGGQADGWARVLAQGLTQRLGQTVVVENRTGAAGQIALDAVIKARADGYTLLFSPTDLVLLPATKLTANYDPIRDFTPIALASRSPMVLAVTDKLPVQSLKDLVAYAKVKPGEIRFGSYGTGGLLHLIGEMLRIKAGIDIVHVPYKGASDAATAVVSGQIEMGIMGISSFHTNAARLRALAQTGPNRSPALTDVPTTKEAGMPEVAAVNWFGIVGPAGTPAPVVTRLNTEVNTLLRQDDIRQRALRLGVEPAPMTPAEFGQYIADELKVWTGLVSAAGITRQ